LKSRRADPVRGVGGLATSSGSGKPDKSGGDDRRQRLDKEYPAADSHTTVNTRHDDAHEKESQNRATVDDSIPRERPEKACCEEAVLKTLVRSQDG